MDRKTRRVTYMTGANSTLSGYGMNEGKKKKKKNGLVQKLRNMLSVAALAAVIALAVSYAFSNTGRTMLGKVTRIGATLSQNVTPFGDSVIFYDGTTLHCMSANGGNEWSMCPKTPASKPPPTAAP